MYVCQILKNKYNRSMRTLVKIIDNTTLQDITDYVNQDGYSHLSRQLSPNKGLVISSQVFDGEVYFNNLGSIRLTDELLLIDNDKIFWNNGLFIPGVIVKRSKINQGKDFIFRTQEWFQVVETTCEVPKDAIVISKPNNAYRFNFNGEQLCFLSPEQILFYVFNGFNVTLDKIMLNAIENGPFERKTKLVGSDNKYKYYAKQCLAKIRIAGIDKVIFSKEDIYGRDNLGKN
jgi:hypothetical protein